MVILWVFLWWIATVIICTGIMEERALDDPAKVSFSVSNKDMDDMLDGTYVANNWYRLNKYNAMKYAYNIYKQGIRVEPEGNSYSPFHSEDYMQFNVRDYNISWYFDTCIQYQWQYAFDYIFNERALKLENARLIDQANH